MPPITKVKSMNEPFEDCGIESDFRGHLDVQTTDQEEEHFRNIPSWPFVQQTSVETPDKQSDIGANANSGDLRSAYEIRCASLVVVRSGMASWHESATFVAIHDEGGGDFVEVSQTPSDRLRHTIAIDPDEWPMLRRAIDQMIAACAVTERK